MANRSITPIESRRIYRMLAMRWLLFFLIVGLVVVLALLSWRRAQTPVQAAFALGGTGF